MNLQEAAKEVGVSKKSLTVSVDLFAGNAPIEQTLILAGEDEPTVDHLYTYLHQTHTNTFPPHRLLYQPMSREAARQALAQGRIHLAGIVSADVDGLRDISLDELQETYTIVDLCHRQVGLIVPKGNPKQIMGLADLARQDITFINHRPDSHTRQQLDVHLVYLS